MTAQSAKPGSLPLSLPPLGLSRTEAAALIGVSPTMFDRMVADGKMPKALRIYGRRTIWDRKKVEAAFAALDTSDEADDVWARCRV